VSFQAKGDLCLGFFQHFWDEGLLPELPKGARVLEIGCAEADWLSSMREARPDLYLVGIDQRVTGDRKAADELVPVLVRDGVEICHHVLNRDRLEAALARPATAVRQGI
jgi:hypothetical protein